MLKRFPDDRGLAIDEVPEGWEAMAWYQHLRHLEMNCVNEANLAEIRKRIAALEGKITIKGD